MTATGPTQGLGSDRLDLLLVGVITKAHGLRGEVVVQAHNADSPLWKKGLELHAVPRDVADRATDRVPRPSTAPLVLEACRRQIAGGEVRLLCTLSGIAGRDAAEALRGLHLAVDERALPSLGDDEFYHHELRGFAVVTAGGEALGTVVGVFPGAAQDLLEIQPPPAAPGGKSPDTWFAPFVSAIVTAIDRGARTITLDPPEGLLP